MVKKNLDVHEPYNRTTVLTWRLPCRANGKIIRFNVECTRDGFPNLVYDIHVTDNREEHFLITDDFLPDSRYKVTVRAVTEHHEGEKYSEMIEIEAGGKIAI